jgi:hypothetical protein
MEVLEIAQVEMFCSGEVVVEGSRRPDVLCVFWEGTCVERNAFIGDFNASSRSLSGPTVWHAGDWTGPISLQPDESRSAFVPPDERPKDIMAVSAEGVKVRKCTYMCEYLRENRQSYPFVSFARLSFCS